MSNMYGYQDSSEVTQGGGGGKFGLNQGFITNFSYNPNAGKDGAQQDAMDLTVQVGEREYRKRFFPVSKVFAKEGGELTDPNSEEYKEALAKEVKLLNADLTSIVECFVSSEDLKQALSAPISSFANFAQILERLVKSVPGWGKKQLDVFLQYQWKPSGDNDKTYLELPKNVKHGVYLTVHQGPGFVENGTSGLKYVNEAGTVHPIKRTQWFAESAYANQTDLGASSPTGNSMNAGASGADWG